MSWFSKICRKPDIPWKDFIGWDVYPSSYLSPFVTTKNTGVYFSESSTPEDFWQQPTGCSTVQKQRVFLRLAPPHPLAGLPIGVSALTLSHYLSQKVSLSASILYCARPNLERLGPGHTLSPCLFFLWCLCDGGEGLGESRGWHGGRHSDVEEDIQRATKIRLFQRRSKAFQWLMLS